MNLTCCRLPNKLRVICMDVHDYVKERRRQRKKIPYGTIGELLQHVESSDLARIITAFTDVAYVRPPKKRPLYNNVTEFCKGNILY